MKDLSHIKIDHSAGIGKNGKRYVYVRPACQCSNKSRRVEIGSLSTLILRHYPVVNYYIVDGHTIGAKSAKNALLEYWRICEREKVGKDFEVEFLHH